MKSGRVVHKIADRIAEEHNLIALEAIDKFARVLALTGMSHEQMTHAFHEACARVPKRFLTGRRTLERELFEAVHILTLWVSDPSYLNQFGEPLRIRSSGASPSLEALAKRIDPKLKLSQVMKFLTRTGSIIRVGKRYSLKRRNVALLANPDLEYANGLEAILGLLRTIEHNAPQKKSRGGWFESATYNPRFPVRLRAQFDAKLQLLGLDFLSRLDAEMERAEQTRRPGEPTVRMRVQLYKCEDDTHRPTPRTRSKLVRDDRRK